MRNLKKKKSTHSLNEDDICEMTFQIQNVYLPCSSEIELRTLYFINNNVDP